MLKSHSSGFTLTELLITIVILTIVISAIFSAYSLSQRAYREGEKAAELTQNGRVILERMVREIRQAREIVTNLPATSTEATSSLEFEDGHIEERYYYIHYFKEENDAKREVRRYYFSGSPGTYVAWDALPPEGEEKLTTTTQVEIIGEFVGDLKFWGPRLINISLTLEKEGKSIDFYTKVFGRNL